MASRPNIRQYPVIVNQSMASNITSAVTIITNLTMASYTFSWVGTTPVGAVSIQASNDYTLGPDGVTVINAGTWNTLPLAISGSLVSSAPVSGNTGNGEIDMCDLAAYAIRAVYTPTSGTGTLNATINCKVA